MNNEETISEKTVTEVLKRCKCRCEGCGADGSHTLHHIFFKSQYYGKDRNLAFNLANLCERCHRIIHHASTDREIRDKNILDYSLKSKALKRKYLPQEQHLLTYRIKLKINYLDNILR